MNHTQYTVIFFICFILHIFQISQHFPSPHHSHPTWNQMLCRASTAVMRRGKSTVTILKCVAATFG